TKAKTSSTTVPESFDARAVAGYSGFTLLDDGTGGSASSGTAIPPPTLPPATPPAMPPSSPATSPVAPSPHTAMPLSSSLSTSSAGFGISFGTSIFFGGGGLSTRRIF